MEKIERGFEVEWVSHLPELPDDMGGDFDRATYECRDFATMNDAERYAKRVVPKSEIGVAMIRDFALDEYGFKDYGRTSVEVSE